jgi:hypothetical protein
MKRYVKVVLEKSVQVKKSVQVRKSVSLDKGNLDVFGLSYPEKRKVLGKRVYLAREEILLLLDKVYLVEKLSVNDLSLWKLQEMLAEKEFEHDNALESLNISVGAIPESAGSLFDSFKIISTNVSVYSEKQYKDTADTVASYHKGVEVGTCAYCGGGTVRDNKVENILYWCNSCCEYTDAKGKKA